MERENLEREMERERIWRERNRVRERIWREREKRSKRERESEREMREKESDGVVAPLCYPRPDQGAWPWPCQGRCRRPSGCPGLGVVAPATPRRRRRVSVGVLGDWWK